MFAVCLFDGFCLRVLSRERVGWRSTQSGKECNHSLGALCSQNSHEWLNSSANFHCGSHQTKTHIYVCIHHRNNPCCSMVHMQHSTKSRQHRTRTHKHTPQNSTSWHAVFPCSWLMQKRAPEFLDLILLRRLVGRPASIWMFSGQSIAEVPVPWCEIKLTLQQVWVTTRGGGNGS